MRLAVLTDSLRMMPVAVMIWNAPPIMSTKKMTDACFCMPRMKDSRKSETVVGFLSMRW